MEITAELKEGKALIRITDVIRGDFETGSGNIRTQIDSFVRDKVSSADVYINSKGGDCFEAIEIVNQLKRFDKVEVNIGSLAASAATYITSFFNTTANHDSKFMIHKPRMVSAGNENEIEASLKLLKDTTIDYCKAYANKTGKSIVQMQAILTKGDVWMTAQEALKEGYINSIEDNTPYKIEPQKNQTQPAIAANYTNDDLLLAMGGKPGWSLEDYLVKDIEAYYVMREKHPLIAAKLESARTSLNINNLNNSTSLNSEMEILAAMGGRTGWSLEHYMKNDMEALWELTEKHPQLKDKLIAITSRV